MTEPEPIPLIIRTRLAHATLQAIADESGADILHIKGPAVDPSLLPQREEAPPDATLEERAIHRVSADADVLVRPEHMRRFSRNLRRHGWLSKTRLTSHGALEHSADWWHPELGSADIHLRFPGIQLRPQIAFTHVWRSRHPYEIAHHSCCVPNLDTQRLVLLLHAARNPGMRQTDVDMSWTELAELERSRIRLLARDLDAEVGLAAALGRLDDYAGRPDYELWTLLVAQESTLPQRIRAVLKASPNAPTSAQTGLQLLVWSLHVARTKATRLRDAPGPHPTITQIVRDYASAVRRQSAAIRDDIRTGPRK